MIHQIVSQLLAWLSLEKQIENTVTASSFQHQFKLVNSQIFNASTWVFFFCCILIRFLGDCC